MPNSILSLLDDEEKKQLFATSQSVHYSTGDSLFNKDDTAQSMYLVVKGKVSLFRLMPNGDEKLFKVFLAGELIAEMAMFMTPRVYPMSARVDQETQLLAFHYTDVLSVFTKSPGISQKSWAI